LWAGLLSYHSSPNLAYLNSSFVDAFVRRMTPQFRGDFQKFEPQHLASVPILDRLMGDESFPAQLASMALRVIDARVKDMVLEAQRFELEIDELITQVAGDRGIEMDP
jgi:hypothetical protein